MRRSRKLIIALTVCTSLFTAGCSLFKPPSASLNILRGKSPTTAPTPVGTDYRQTTGQVAVDAQAKGTIGNIEFAFNGNGYPLMGFVCFLTLVCAIFWGAWLRSRRRERLFAVILKKLIKAVEVSDSRDAKQAFEEAVSETPVEPVVKTLLQDSGVKKD